MSLLIFIILSGILQGLTEFLPISSSGHLTVLQNLKFSSGPFKTLEAQIEATTFDIILHAGTLLAILLYFYKDIIQLITDFFKDVIQRDFSGPGLKSTLLVVVGTLPLIPMVKYKNSIHFFKTLEAVAILFIINGLILSVSEYFFKKSNNHELIKNYRELSVLKAFVIGIAQLFATLPGISRSGSTLSASLWFHLKPSEGIKFSFLLSIPALCGAILVALKDLLEKSAAIDINYMFLGIGLGVSFLAGLVSLLILVWFTKNLKLTAFGVYTIVLGIALLLFGR